MMILKSGADLAQHFSSYLIAKVISDNFKLNSIPSAGWVFDGKLWLISKMFIDEFRNDMKEDGFTVPDTNFLVLRELFEQGLIANISTNDMFKFVQKKTVRVNERSTVVSLVSFPLEKIWVNSNDYPNELSNVEIS